MNSDKPHAILVNVGGATAPAIHTLNSQKPPYICFFVSADSEPLIRSKILPALDYNPDHYDWIKTDSPQNLLECYQVLAENLHRVLNKWGIPLENLGVEFTAGTKPMSVAAVLVTIESCSQYFYVGSIDASGRDREGIGVVLDGQEKCWFQSNPWEVLAVQARKEIALLFNHGRFIDAREKALRLAKVVPADMQNVYESLAQLIEGYSSWDRFEYKLANNQLHKAITQLNLYIAGRDDPLRATLDVVKTQVDHLRTLCENTAASHQLDILDMLANAARRAQKANKYDDATARLYSALENLARYRLLDTYQIKTNNVKLEQIPEVVREDYQQRYSNPDEPEAGLKLGLEASYKLLDALGDELGKKYQENEKELMKVLFARNQSRLAHGSEPVKPETYEKLRGIVMRFAGVTEDELPIFPEMML